MEEIMEAMISIKYYLLTDAAFCHDAADGGGPAFGLFRPALRLRFHQSRRVRSQSTNPWNSKPAKFLDGQCGRSHRLVGVASAAASG